MVHGIHMLPASMHGWVAEVGKNVVIVDGDL